MFVWYTAVRQRHHWPCVSRAVWRRVRRARGVGRRTARNVRSAGVCSQLRSASCARRAAVVLPRIRAQPCPEVLGKVLGSATQHGAGCGVQCTRSAGGSRGNESRMCEGAVRAADAISAAPRVLGTGPCAPEREAMMRSGEHDEEVPSSTLDTHAEADPPVVTACFTRAHPRAP